MESIGAVTSCGWMDYIYSYLVKGHLTYSTMHDQDLIKVAVVHIVLTFPRIWHEYVCMGCSYQTL